MKKLKLSDLTPNMMKHLEGMKTPAEAVEYFAGLGFSVSEKGAGTLMDQMKKVNELSLDDLKKVAGGRNEYGSEDATQYDSEGNIIVRWYS